MQDSDVTIHNGFKIETVHVVFSWTFEITLILFKHFDHFIYQIDKYLDIEYKC